VAAANRKAPNPHDTILYRRWHKIENMFGRLKDWRHIHARYVRCAHTFVSAISPAAIVIFWMGSMSTDREAGLR
jgi:transposase